MGRAGSHGGQELVERIQLHELDAGVLEDLLPGSAQFTAQDPIQVFELRRGHLVLKAGHLGDKFSRDQIRTRREHLGQLDERGAEFLEGHSNPDRPCQPLEPVPFLAGKHLQADFDVLIDPKPFDQVAETVLEQHGQDIPVPAKMAVGSSKNPDFSNTQHIGSIGQWVDWVTGEFINRSTRHSAERC